MDAVGKPDATTDSRGTRPSCLDADDRLVETIDALDAINDDNLRHNAMSPVSPIRRQGSAFSNMDVADANGATTDAPEARQPGGDESGRQNIMPSTD